MDCSGVPVIDIGELGQGFLEYLGGRRHPLGVTMEVTERCNNSCVHCYINQPAGDRQAKARELTFAQISELTGLPLGTVKARMRYGLGKLSRMLSGRQGDET